MTTETWEQRRDREKAEAIERTRGLFTFAADLAALLGPEWLVAPVDADREFQHSHPHIRRSTDGATFWLSIVTYGSSKGRIEVHGDWPKDAKGTEHRPYFSEHSENGASAPGISFSASKTPAVAARDIERRFLTAYLPLYEKQVKVAQGRDTYVASRQSIAERVAKLLKGEVTTRGGREEATVWLGHRERGIAAVEFSGDEKSLKVEIRCTLAELEALTKLFPPKKGEGQS